MFTPLNRFYLKDFVYGSIDGLVTTFAVVAGATGASLSSTVIIILGLANLIADGFSMSVGNYLSMKTQHHLTAGDDPAYISRISPLAAAVVTFFSFLSIGVIPLSLYLLNSFGWISMNYLFVGSCLLTGLTFGLIGFLRSYVTKSKVWAGILETLVLGGLAATLAYYTGDFLRRIV